MFGIKRLRVRHAPGQPEDNQCVGRRFDCFFRRIRQDGARITGRQRAERRGDEQAKRRSEKTSSNGNRHVSSPAAETKASAPAQKQAQRFGAPEFNRTARDRNRWRDCLNRKLVAGPAAAGDLTSGLQRRDGRAADGRRTASSSRARSGCSRTIL